MTGFSTAPKCKSDATNVLYPGAMLTWSAIEFRCRIHDQDNTAASGTAAARSHASVAGNYPYASGNAEPRDIIPRASPSRPSSMHFAPPVGHMSALSALRSLSIRDPSPPSPTMMPAYNTTSTIWPFTRSAAASPVTSYTRPSAGMFSSTYDTSYYSSASTYAMTSVGADRPLPSRRPGTYARPKSIELVTPMVGR